MPHLITLAKSTNKTKPALLITSGGLYKNPYHGYFSLSASKAAQFSITTSLGQRFVKEGVNVGAVVVHGLVRKDSEWFSPERIAGIFWECYAAGTGRWKKGDVREVWVTEGDTAKI
jgi:hypothetical protein